jgi:Family of unknown function (DUF5694)
LRIATILQKSKKNKMKRLLLVIFFAINCTNSFAQANPKKIKIILLGTFHFNQSLDSSSKLHSDLFSTKRQKEVADLVNKLAKQKPDKIFLEFTQKDKQYYDSIYNDYVKGKEPERLKTKANEIFQLGMKTAKKVGLKNVVGINYQPEELSEKEYKPLNIADKALQDLYMAIGRFEDSTRSNTKFYDLAYPFKQPKQDSLLQKTTLTEFILQLNTAKRQQYEEYSNWNFFYSVGSDNMNATDLVGTFWYGANVRNYNNVLRQADIEKDKCYLIIYGSSHISFLKYLFEMNPYFEVVDLNKVLK